MKRFCSNSNDFFKRFESQSVGMLQQRLQLISKWLQWRYLLIYVWKKSQFDPKKAENIEYIQLLTILVIDCET